jgi:aspartyl-tRNA(Asn)/glutamyl-tRNA(Gln) amidotransferase subunit A
MSGERTAPLWQLSASELAAYYGPGTTTPQEVLAATLERVEEVNPRLNALITLNRDGARVAATASTERWRAGQARGPLDGVPITIKDSLLVAGLRATWGSRLYADHVPQTDETPVARLREAGAVILGKTNVPEFTLQGYTDNPLFGPTRNPWNTDLTPGGSSGGAVAAVAAGLGALAIGTDGGGSIRRPASHTGLVGFKPSRGAVPRDGGFPAILLDFEAAGPIARCVDDIIAAMSVIGAPSATGSSSDETVARCRVLFAPTFGDAPVDPEIAASVAAAAAELDRQGHWVTQAAHFDLADAIGDIWPIVSQTGVAWLLSRHADWKGNVGSAIAAMAEAGAKLSAAQYLGALDAVAGMRRRFAQHFEPYDLLLTPTAAALPWPATETHPPMIAGQSVGPRGHAVFTPLANALGLPAISLPCAPSSRGLPIGFQLVAREGADALLLSVARDYERKAGMRYRWPKIQETAEKLIWL